MDKIFNGKILGVDIIWILTFIFSIGVFCQSVRSQDEAIASLKQMVIEQQHRVERIEIIAVKLDNLATSMAEVRQDVKDIKKDLYTKRP